MSTEPDPRVVIKFANSIDDDELADASRRFSEQFPKLKLDKSFLA